MNQTNQKPQTNPANNEFYELRIGSETLPEVFEDHDYPTIREYLRAIDILKYDEYAGELSNKEKNWSSEGIDHFAADLGIGIVEQVIFSTPQFWIIQARARCVTDNNSRCASVTQPKQMWDTEKKRYVSDPYALEKGCSRADRNAIKKMIPSVLLRTMLEDAKKDAAFRSVVQNAQNAARVAIQNNRGNYEGLTPTEILEILIAGRGPTDTWGADDWNYLRESISNPNSDLLVFAKKMKASSQQEEPEPDPEPEPEPPSEETQEDAGSKNEEQSEVSEDWETVAQNITPTNGDSEDIHTSEGEQLEIGQ